MRFVRLSPRGAARTFVMVFMGMVVLLSDLSYSVTLMFASCVQEPPKAALLEYEASGRQGPKPASPRSLHHPAPS